MEILFYKPFFSWPRSSGHDVHTYHIMRELANLGVSISLATDSPSPSPSLQGLALRHNFSLDSSNIVKCCAAHPYRGLEERFRKYWGISSDHLERFAAVAKSRPFDFVVVSGLSVLPMLLPISDSLRIWYAADEWMWHHLSQVHLFNVSSWSNVKDALIKGLYERAFRHRIDAACLVTNNDAKAMRLVAGVKNVEILPNGVDAEYYAPREVDEKPESLIFWGRLDFGPNIQALQWFISRVWPRIRARRTRAQFTVMGFNPGPFVKTLNGHNGITVMADVDDIRDEIARHSVVILPFISGGGIKNKLLEAAAMGKPILATKRTLFGLQGQPPIKTATTPQQWEEAIEFFWDHPEARKQLGSSARDWVKREHNWASVAAKMLKWLEQKVNHGGTII